MLSWTGRIARLWRRIAALQILGIDRNLLLHFLHTAPPWLGINYFPHRCALLYASTNAHSTLANQGGVGFMVSLKQMQIITIRATLIYSLKLQV